jgi:virginiamycin B lyase
VRLLYVLAPAAIVLAIGATASAAGFENKSVKTITHKGHQPTGAAEGIKTPGVQIPISRLKAEAEIPSPAKPAWIFVSDHAFIQTADGLNPIDAKTGKAGTAVTGLGNACDGIASGFSSLWVPLCGEGALAKLDGKSYKAGPKILTGVSSVPGIIAATGDSLWMLTDDKTTLTRIDPMQNQVVADLRIEAGCRGLTFGETALWIACPSNNKVIRFNPETNLVEKRIEVSAEPEAVAVGEGSVWVYCRKDGKIDRIDPKTDKVSKSIDVGLAGLDSQIAVGEGSVWLTSAGFPITRIDPKSETVVQQFTGEGGGAITTGGGFVWLSNRNLGTVWKIDPKLVALTLPE